jgi:hypothetical protein
VNGWGRCQSWAFGEDTQVPPLESRFTQRTTGHEHCYVQCPDRYSTHPGLHRPSADCIVCESDLPRPDCQRLLDDALARIRREVPVAFHGRVYGRQSYHVEGGGGGVGRHEITGVCTVTTYQPQPATGQGESCGCPGVMDHPRCIVAASSCGFALEHSAAGMTLEALDRSIPEGVSMTRDGDYERPSCSTCEHVPATDPAGKYDCLDRTQRQLASFPEASRAALLTQIVQYKKTLFQVAPHALTSSHRQDAFQLMRDYPDVTPVCE